MDKDSKWTFDNGLPTVLTVSLTFGMLGYPFVLPDMIGGNAYAAGPHPLNGHYIPQRQLFIRWLQASALLPSMQYSIAPWDYDQQVIDHAKDIMSLREKYQDTLVSLASQSVKDGSPIIRPLWWTGDESEAALTVGTQYMVGDNLMLAPVLAENATSRSVYLPKGSSWTGIIDKKTYTGGQNIIQSATLFQLPLYIKTH